MPFEIVRNDITNMQVDAIVNTANPRPVIGSGTDAAIHAKAGRLLLMARRGIGTIKTGEARITPGFRLPAKYVIHTVGPVWEDGSCGEAELLRQCYVNSLALAKKKKLTSVAFPLISSGNYGFPKDLALKVATEAIREFLEENDMDVFLVVFSRESFQLSAKLQKDIRSFIDEQYAREQTAKEYSFTVRSSYEHVEKIFEDRESQAYVQEEENAPKQGARIFDVWDEDGAYSSWDDEIDWWDIPQFRRSKPEQEETCCPGASMPMAEKPGEETVCPSAQEPVIADTCAAAPEPFDDKVYGNEDSGWEESSAPTVSAPRSSRRAKLRRETAPAPKAPCPSISLEEMLKKQDAGFSTTLLQMIDRTGKKDSEIYRKANVSRQHFSKIRNNPQYKPTKSTALAFAIALELDLEQTKDLIGRAGYALTNSSKADLIIMYFINKGHYNIIDINTALFEFDQSLLGA